MSKIDSKILRNLDRDMMRHAAQSAVAASGSFLILNALGFQEMFLGVISSVLIITPSVGGTMGAAFTRLQATAVGSLISLCCLMVFPETWSTAVALALSMLVVGGVAGIRPDWSYGAVAAIGIALPGDMGIFATASARAVAIGVGATTGVLVSLLVWPDRAESRFDRHFRTALRASATRLSDALEAATAERDDAAPSDHVSAYHKAVQEAQESLNAVKLVDRAGMQRRLDALRWLYNSVIVLDRAAKADILSTSTDMNLVEEIGDLRRDMCEVLIILAERKTCTDPRTRQIDKTLKRLEDVFSEDNLSAELRRNRDTLTFGLHEVRIALSDLIEVAKAH
ncbi:FUSC family protein [Paracoccus liaowanqingii]|uniref:FUSC family protein n=1 Tax=Paracoccus liaowanqingii TaxID=2560053 RepID=A0A4Z1C0I0_9RHOB|nr:FUSC family protein [Paracoccus liaowanqingii]TGN61816.1 FUSC family protein [Paracoccus liaowanqingii]